MRFQYGLTILAVLFLWICPPKALALYDFSFQAAGAFNTSNYGIASSPNLLLGARLSTDLNYPFQLGVAYEHDNLNYTDGSGDGSLKFFGVVTRVKTASPWFFDGQAGIDDRDSVGISFSWGVGAGFTYPIEKSIDLEPRVGYRFVPDGGTERSMMDLGLLITVKIP